MIPSVFARPWRSQTTFRTRRRRRPSRLRGLSPFVELWSREGSPDGIPLFLNEFHTLQDAVKIGARKRGIRDVDDLNFAFGVDDQKARLRKRAIGFFSRAWLGDIESQGPHLVQRQAMPNRKKPRSEEHTSELQSHHELV